MSDAILSADEVARLIRELGPRAEVVSAIATSHEALRALVVQLEGERDGAAGLYNAMLTAKIEAENGVIHWGREAERLNECLAAAEARCVTLTERAEIAERCNAKLVGVLREARAIIVQYRDWATAVEAEWHYRDVMDAIGVRMRAVLASVELGDDEGEK